MKYVPFYVCCSILSLLLNTGKAQESLNWKNCELPMDQKFCSFYTDDDGIVDIVFGKQVGFTNNCWLALSYGQLSANFSYSGLIIPSKQPYYFKSVPFFNYLVVVGGTPENPGKPYPMCGNIYGTDIYFYDKNGSLVMEDAIRATNNGNTCFHKFPFLYFAPHDSTLIVLAFEDNRDKNVGLKYGTYIHIKAYDAELNVIVNFKRFLDPEGYFISDLGIDFEIFNSFPGALSFLYSHTTSTKESFITANSKNTMYVGIAALDSEKDTLYHLKKKLPLYNGKYAFLSIQNRLLVSGVSYYPDKKTQNLFFYTKETTDAGELAGTELEIDESFYVKNGLDPNELVKGPQQILPLSDGYITYFESLYIDEGIVYYLGNIFLIKYDLSGNVEWCKAIYKNHGSKYYYHPESKVFVRDNEVFVFYFDTPTNLNCNEGKSIERSAPSNACLVMAHVTSDGQVNKKIIDVTKTSKVVPFINDIIELEDGSFLVAGINIDAKIKKVYIASFVP